RLVWCPKWTPASRSSRLVTTGTRYSFRLSPPPVLAGSARLSPGPRDRSPCVRIWRIAPALESNSGPGDRPPRSGTSPRARSAGTLPSLRPASHRLLGHVGLDRQPAGAERGQDHGVDERRDQ